MSTRIFSSQLEQNAPETRTVDDDAPGGLRLELIDSIFSLAERDTREYTGPRVTSGQLYRVMKQSMGLMMAPDNPMNGVRSGAARQMRDLTWQRVYDLICRWFLEFPADMQEEYIQNVNGLLAAHRIAWDLRSDGKLHRVLPAPVQAQVEVALGLLGNARFKAALTSFRDALNAYDDRPQRGRDACKNAMDALESVAKVVFNMPRATLGDVLTEARKRQSIAAEAISVVQKLYDMTNHHLRHGQTTPFALKPAEIDFVVISCMSGILLFGRM